MTNTSYEVVIVPGKLRGNLQTTLFTTLFRKSAFFIYHEIWATKARLGGVQCRHLCKLKVNMTNTSYEVVIVPGKLR